MRRNRKKCVKTLRVKISISRMNAEMLPLCTREAYLSRQIFL